MKVFLKIKKNLISNWIDRKNPFAMGVLWGYLFASFCEKIG